MKTILLMRHGKSQHPANCADFERPLAPRGLKDAPRMGKLLKKYKCIPDKVLSSPALRASQTAELLAEKMGIKNRITYLKEFYGCSTSNYLRHLRSLDDSLNCVIIVGHNPSMKDATAAFCSKIHMEADFPTCAIACFDSPVDNWKNLELGDSSLRFLVIPKLIKKNT